MRFIGKREEEQLHLLTLTKLRKREDLKQRLKISITSSLLLFLCCFVHFRQSFLPSSKQSEPAQFLPTALLPSGQMRCLDVVLDLRWLLVLSEVSGRFPLGFSRNTTPPFVLHALEDALFLLSGWVSRCRLRSQLSVPILFPKTPHETFQAGIIKRSLPSPNFY